jgi:hypothetical protein
MTGLDTVPAWAIGYAVAFVVLHLVVGYYFYRRTRELGLEGDGRAGMMTEGGLDRIEETSASRELPDDASVVRCRHCETENEGGYRYCRNCVQQLPSIARQSASTTMPNERGSL